MSGWRYGTRCEIEGTRIIEFTENGDLGISPFLGISPLDIRPDTQLRTPLFSVPQISTHLFSRFHVVSLSPTGAPYSHGTQTRTAMLTAPFTVQNHH